MAKKKTASNDPARQIKDLRDRVHQLEKQNKQLTDQLHHLEERRNRLRQLLDIVPDIIFAADWNGNFILANQGLADIAGTTVENILHHRIGDFTNNRPQTRRLLADNRKVIRSRKPSLIPEQTLVGPDNIPRVFRIKRIPYTQAHTGEKAVLGVATDITDRKRIENELAASRGAVIFGLAKLAESRDNDTGLHLERICQYTEVLARRISQDDPGLDDQWIDNITATAALHDIGKVATPDAVLLKPGKLDAAERRIIEKHPCTGGDRLIELKHRWGDDPFLITAAEIALAHHEKWDGSGYPFGLQADTIPLSARIVALADVYDALTSKRVYKPSLSHNQARDIIIDGAGSHFDPDMVNAFLEVQKEFRAIARQMRSTSEKRNP